MSSSSSSSPSSSSEFVSLQSKLRSRSQSRTYYSVFPKSWHHGHHSQQQRSVTIAVSLLVVSAVVRPLLPTVHAFISFNGCRPHGTTTQHTFSKRTIPFSTSLFFTMPDVSEMKSLEMRHELESYGIDCKTMFDKRDFEAALLQARKEYEQTLKDCMSNSQAYSEKEQSRKKGASTFSTATTKEQNHKKSVHYDRTNPTHYHETERMWDMSNDYASREGFRTADPVGPPPPPPPRHGDPFYNDPYAYGRQRARGPRPRSPRKNPIETDPLFDHEAQYSYGGGGGRGWPRPGSPPPHGSVRDPRRREAENTHFSSSRHPHPQYNDPATQMMYHETLQKSFGMKVDELQTELNQRGISTKFCMTLSDFCIEYAKAVAENKPKQEENKQASSFSEDDDYDPTYRDVVMEPYDPNSFF